MRLLYIICRILEDIGSLLSRGANAILFNGSTAQTLSARSYLDGRNNKTWRRIGRAINWFFFWQENHIKRSWGKEVDRARYVLKRLEGMKRY